MIFDTTSEFGRVEKVELPEDTDSSLTVKRVYGEDEGDYAVLLHSTKRNFVLANELSGDVVHGNFLLLSITNGVLTVAANMWLDPWTDVAPAEGKNGSWVEQNVMKLIERGERRDENGNVVPEHFS